MNLHDNAYELAKAIRSCPEFQAMQAAKEKVEANEEAKKMLVDFRTRQAEMQNQMMTGQMPPEDEMQDLQKMFEAVGANPVIAELFDAERRLSVLMEDVQKIIAAPFQDLA
ncbi:YlbF family regulator [Paenibacillus sp. N1-5-1-14]|uniref:YlbF family regulator n=1 Tax=Paenibacillus radicibacter TaxID=2972488 RepID=UPI002158F000|nr:YlbF family regulator [Paenibacillus radicibacter]MCR8643698.1 YlbF family regulator [Paenibacillus radicibacter]